MRDAQRKINKVTAGSERAHHAVQRGHCISGTAASHLPERHYDNRFGGQRNSHRNRKPDQNDDRESPDESLPQACDIRSHFRNPG